MNDRYDETAAHGGNLYLASRLHAGAPETFLDFSANINPLGLPATVHAAVCWALPMVVHYPDTESALLRQAISAAYGVAEPMITVGNGATELIYVFCHMTRPRRVLLCAPTFGEYERAARAAGAEIRVVPQSRGDGFRISAAALTEQVDGVDAVFVCNPNNPTGALLERPELEPLLIAAAAAGAVVAVDESFLDFLPDDGPYTCRPLLGEYPNLLIFHSLTKFYAIPGLRLGFAAASPALTRLLHRGKDPWNVNSLAQAAGAAALGDTAFRAESRQFVARARGELMAGLTALPEVTPFCSPVNFILADIAATGLTASGLADRMAQRGILIRDCSNYRGLTPEYIRLAVRTPEENHRLLAALREVLGG